MQEIELIQVAEAYTAHTGRKMSTVGRYAANDGKFFQRLQDGMGCTLRTARAVTQWFSDNWPADLEWPRAIPRPPRAKKEAA